MTFYKSQQAWYATILIGGALILLLRTVVMWTNGSLELLKPWVGGLLIAEFALDLGWLLAAVRWLLFRKWDHAPLALWLCAAAIWLHLVRVYVFVFGRTGPWINWDVRPERLMEFNNQWSWTDVYLAGTLSVLGALGTIWVYRSIRQGHVRE